MADLVETAAFARAAVRLWTADEYRALQGFLARNPESGVVIPSSGGLRKLRWSLRGSGKRGGARVIYFWRSPAGHILLLAAYAKSETEDLTRAELAALARVASEF